MEQRGNIRELLRDSIQQAQILERSTYLPMFYECFLDITQQGQTEVSSPLQDGSHLDAHGLCQAGSRLLLQCD